MIYTLWENSVSQKIKNQICVLYQSLKETTDINVINFKINLSWLLNGVRIYVKYSHSFLDIGLKYL